MYDRIEVKPISGAVGADVFGVDLARELDAQTFAEIERAFTEHLVVVFRDQKLTPQQQVAFSKRFGSLTRTPFIQPLAEHPDVIAIVRAADESKETRNFGGSWHCDATFVEKPPLGATLYALEVPPFGGDTLFANLYLAYESLSDGMREMLDRLILMHAPVPYDPDRGAKTVQSSLSQRGMNVQDVLDPKKEVEHPLVREHPVSRRKLLWMPGPFAVRFKGMTEPESKPLIDFLAAHVIRPEFTGRIRWTPRALTMWDNRCTQHFAINDYAGYRRAMHRVQIAGERPYGPAMPRDVAAPEALPV